jgi:hypothetical protein
MIWSSMTYKSYGAHEWVLCIKVDDGARPAKSNGGDLVGASLFLERGR